MSDYVVFSRGLSRYAARTASPGGSAYGVIWLLSSKDHSRVMRCVAAVKLMKRILAAIGVTAIAAAMHAAPSIELLAPRPGTVLEGGRETTLTWSASSLPAHAEEWEAFLSIDGGRYYATRITPHLDAGRRTFRWRALSPTPSRPRSRRRRPPSPKPSSRISSPRASCCPAPAGW